MPQVLLLSLFWSWGRAWSLLQSPTAPADGWCFGGASLAGPGSGKGKRDAFVFMLCTGPGFCGEHWRQWTHLETELTPG